jgi:hypothetical protein
MHSRRRDGRVLPGAQHGPCRDSRESLEADRRRGGHDVGRIEPERRVQKFRNDRSIRPPQTSGAIESATSATTKVRCNFRAPDVFTKPPGPPGGPFPCGPHVDDERVAIAPQMKALRPVARGVSGSRTVGHAAYKEAKTVPFADEAGESESPSPGTLRGADPSPATADFTPAGRSCAGTSRTGIASRPAARQCRAAAVRGRRPGLGRSARPD